MDIPVTQVIATWPYEYRYHGLYQSASGCRDNQQLGSEEFGYKTEYVSAE